MQKLEGYPHYCQQASERNHRLAWGPFFDLLGFFYLGGRDPYSDLFLNPQENSTKVKSSR